MSSLAQPVSRVFSGISYYCLSKKEPFLVQISPVVCLLGMSTERCIGFHYSQAGVLRRNSLVLNPVKPVFFNYYYTVHSFS